MEKETKVAAVSMKNITKTFGSVIANDKVNLDIYKGEILSLLGENGSGKTTLIKMLNGLLTPTEGTIMIDGNYVGPATKSKVAYLPDRTYLTMNQTIREILDFFQDFYTDFSRERAEEMLKSLGIDPAVKMRTLSKGTKEKVQLILVMSRWVRCIFWMSRLPVWIRQREITSCAPLSTTTIRKQRY